MKQPFFSIVVPCYNRAPFIGSLIKSIQNQGFEDFEIILIDDGSTDNTKEVVSKIQNTENRIKYFFHSNRERGASRNEGYKRSVGEFGMFLDSDDLLAENSLFLFKKLIEENPGYKLYSSKFIINDKAGNKYPPVFYFKPGAYDFEMIIKGNPLGTMFLVKREYKNFILFPEERTFSTMEDWLCLTFNMWYQKLFLGDFIGFILNEHEGRSMNQNKIVIERRLLATSEINNRMNLNSKQKRLLFGYSYYFCSVHA